MILDKILLGSLVVILITNVLGNDHGMMASKSECLKSKVSLGKIGASHEKCGRQAEKFELYLVGEESQRGPVINKRVT